jgi:hypothetical protein
MLCPERLSIEEVPVVGRDTYEALLSAPLHAPQFLKKIRRDHALLSLQLAFLSAAASGHISRCSMPRAMPSSTSPIIEGEAGEVCAYAPI